MYLPLFLIDFGTSSFMEQRKNKLTKIWPNMDTKEAKMDFKSILKEVEYLGSAHMTWREKKELENKKVVSLGGKPQKKQRLPLSVARVMMKKQKEREEKMQEENLILGRFGGNNASSSRKAAGRRRPEDRVLKSTEGHFRNGVLDVKELLKPSSAPKAASFDAKQSFSSGKGKKKKGGKKNKGNKNKGGPDKELDEETFLNKYGNDNSAHVPVLLGEVLDVFTSVTLRSFLDCTLGAAGHSSEIIRAHSEMQVYVGLDVDPIAHQMAQSQLKSIIDRDSFDTASALKVHTFLKKFKDVKSVLGEVEDDLLVCGVDGILMDLGMSSMQVNAAARGFSVLKNGPLDMRMNPKATLKAEDVLNS
ncbi:hypothetical protein K7X08_030677 [Anisodus acutangulus]|uniref:Uncharacterized protein n=1 Tax=Anisodus acutangulus TaxID=402998 RepID=A0A9Q1R936_9SOLA|nr:hypothetical protein K7X08_030677 [Anisodus acutangulus]